MKTVAYRVREILAGHSRTAAVVAVDSEGREVRLEVGALEGASIHVDEVLILSWATVVVPTADVQREADAAEEPLPDRPVEEAYEEASPPVEDLPESPAAVLAEFEALLGLH